MIKVVPDVGAPVAVVAVDLLTEQYAPTYNEWAAYILAVGGYVGAWMGWGGEFVKNMGIASLPWAAKKAYSRFKGGTTASRPSSRMAFQRVSRFPAPAQETQFQGVRVTSIT